MCPWARHRWSIPPAVVLVALAGLGGCVTPTTERAELDESVVERERELQRRLVIEHQLEHQRRLMAVSYPLLRAATPLCVNDLGRGVGLRFANVYGYEPEYRRAAAAVLGLDEWVRIIHVSPRSASEAAGLTPGEAITRINGDEIRPGRYALGQARRSLDSAARKGGPIEIQVSGPKGIREVAIEPEPICYYPVVLVGDDRINAYADGETIYVTRGMLRFAEHDEDLALVIAHELAHNAMAHDEAQRTNRMVGQLIDLAAKAYGLDTRGAFTTIAMRSRSEDFEAEADYVALYAMALAGLPVAEAADFWRLMAIEHPESIEDGYLATHPSTAERYVAIEAAIDEVYEKQAAGERLMPNHRRFVSRFETPPRAFRTAHGMALDTRSGRPVELPRGCWRKVGETRHGAAYIPEQGTLSIHGESAALILDEARARGLWKINRSRFLALDEPLPMDSVAEPLFECGAGSDNPPPGPPARAGPPALPVIGPLAR
jgi:hypothetical protein